MSLMAAAGLSGEVSVALAASFFYHVTDGSSGVERLGVICAGAGSARRVARGAMLIWVRSCTCPSMTRAPTSSGSIASASSGPPRCAHCLSPPLIESHPVFCLVEVWKSAAGVACVMVQSFRVQPEIVLFHASAVPCASLAGSRGRVLADTLLGQP